MVTTDNYEEYLMMQADGELNAQELLALQRFLDAHPELASEAAAWQDLKLVPDGDVRFGQQESLLKEERKAIAFRPWHLAVPAAAALLLALFLIPRSGQESTTTPLADNTAPTTRIIENDPAPTQTNAPQEIESAMPVPNPPVPSRRRPARRPQHLAIVKTIDAVRAPAGQERLARLQPSGGSPVSVEPAAMEAPQLLALAAPQQAMMQAPEPAQDSRMRIQLAAANVDAINAVKSGIDQRIEQLGRAAKTVRESAVVIKLGGNAFHINL